MSFATASVVPSLLGLGATSLFGGKKSSPAPAAPAPAAAPAPDVAVATRQAQVRSQAAGAAVSSLGSTEDDMTAQAKDKSARRTLLG